VFLVVRKRGRFGRRSNCDDSSDAGGDLFFQRREIDSAIAKWSYDCGESAFEHGVR
jgi:hypothetical protein